MTTGMEKEPMQSKLGQEGYLLLTFQLLESGINSLCTLLHFYEYPEQRLLEISGIKHSYVSNQRCFSKTFS